MSVSIFVINPTLFCFSVPLVDRASRCYRDQIEQFCFSQSRTLWFVSLFFLNIPAISLSVPRESNAIVDAARWADTVLLGPIATSVAVMAVAFIGFAMLNGRISWRRGASVILGCFLIFGSRSIVAGFDYREQQPPESVNAATPPPPAFPPPPEGYDPYAGASIKR